jgi:hypothetical protein
MAINEETECIYVSMGNGTISIYTGSRMENTIILLFSISGIWFDPGKGMPG